MAGKIVAAALAALFLSGGAALASPCTDLNGRVVENGQVRAAVDVRAGEALRLGGVRVDDLPAFCRITASAGLDRHSNILIELWLPAPGRWNHKLLGTGNGGFAGSISFGALRGGLARGYAVMNTDMGTFPASSASWAAGTGQPEMLKDWGYRSTHEMTLIGTALTGLYYGEAPRRRYFEGCSTGGHQALMEAQLYPDDYDAILAGAPANNRTHLHLSFLQVGLDVHATPDSWLDGPHVALVHDAVLKTCAGKDGGAPGDRFLTDPTQCSLSRANCCASRVRTRRSASTVHRWRRWNVFMAGPPIGAPERFSIPVGRWAAKCSLRACSASVTGPCRGLSDRWCPGRWARASM